MWELPQDTNKEVTQQIVKTNTDNLQPGQDTMANSIPVTIASDQTPVPVSGIINQSNSRSVIEEIQMTGEYNGKIAYAFNILGQRSGFTSTSVLNGVKEYDNGVADFAVTSSSTLDIISSSVNDTAAGTGVRTVKVTYIDSSNNLVESAPIVLNGTTLVTSVLTGVNQVLWMEAASVGSGGVAAGNIRLRINGGVVQVEQITAGGNKSRSGIFMIPTGYTGYLVNVHSTAINSDQDVRVRATVNTLDRSLSSVFHYQTELYTPINTIFQDHDLWLRLPATSKIKANTMSAGTAGTVRCNINMLIIIIEN